MITNSNVRYNSFPILDVISGTLRIKNVLFGQLKVIFILELIEFSTMEVANALYGCVHREAQKLNIVTSNPDVQTAWGEGNYGHRI